nr:MAG TPA: hypothetical protein [Caudoviricetes sp.]
MWALPRDSGLCPENPRGSCLQPGKGFTPLHSRGGLSD